jgi:hypothetical protein
MHTQSPYPDTTPVVRNIRSLANRHNEQKHCPSGNSRSPPAKRCVSVPVGERDSSQGGSSVPSTIQGQNSAPCSLLNDSCVADINQRVTSTPSATQRRSINSPTAMSGTSSCRTPVPGGTSTVHIDSSPPYSIVIAPTPLCSLENMPTPIINPEARAIITNPL